MTSSFKQRIGYLFRHGHDLFAVVQHLALPPKETVPEMDGTWISQPHLKAATGIRRGGRRCTKPVSHDILSWDEDETPNFEEMIRTAKSFLVAVGLAEHQAVMVGHDHNGKRHVHIVANAVHPITGRVADRTDDQVKAQAWALAYEVAQGRIRCRHRTAPKIDRAFALATTGRKKSGQRLSRANRVRKQKQRAADAEARARHKAGQWAELTAQQERAAAKCRPTAGPAKSGHVAYPAPMTVLA